MAVALGDLVKDRITGFEGVASTQQTWLGAAVRFGVAPRSLKDGQPQKVNAFDTTDLIVVKKGVIKAKKPGKTKFAMGDKVKDRFSDAIGSLTAEALHLNGCRKWQFTNELMNNKRYIVEHFLDEARLEKVAAAKVPVKTIGTGGDQLDLGGHPELG